MGSALYIVAEDKPRDFDMLMDGKGLAMAAEQLGVLCTTIGVKRVMDFFSQDPEELADMLGEEVPNAPPEQWFEAREGLSMVRALVSRLESGAESFKNSAHVIADLRECERILTFLDQEGIKWHFAIDI